MFIKPRCPGGQWFRGVRLRDVHFVGQGGDMQGGKQQRLRYEQLGCLEITSSGVSLFPFSFWLQGAGVEDR